MTSFKINIDNFVVNVVISRKDASDDNSVPENVGKRRLNINISSSSPFEFELELKGLSVEAVDVAGNLRNKFVVRIERPSLSDLEVSVARKFADLRVPSSVFQ